VTFGAGQLTSIETIVLLSGADTRFGGGGLSFSYSLSMNEGNVAAGATMIVNANNLRSGETLVFDGTSESDGAFRVFGGAGNDVIFTGGGNDQLYGGAGADTLHGGPGNDSFVYLSAAHSTAVTRDLIADFTSGDRIDLSAIDANTTAGANDPFAFVGTAAFSHTAGELRYEAAGNDWVVQGDTDGDGAADFEVLVRIADSHALGAGDFVL
jgi:Ca2+-binding RTX toxin-like protein